MNFEKTLISGQFIKRYKRFFVDVRLKNTTVTAHCPNTGSMMGLLNKGNNVWLSKTDNEKENLSILYKLLKIKIQKLVLIRTLQIRLFLKV